MLNRKTRHLNRQILKPNRPLEEDIVNLKKVQRTPDEAIGKAKQSPVTGIDPYQYIIDNWVKAKRAVVKGFKSEFKSTDANVKKITFSNSCISNGHFTPNADKQMVIGVHIYMKAKKSVWSRFLTGKIGNWGKLHKGIMKTIVSTMFGKEYANDINDDVIFNAVGSQENTGKDSFFICIKFNT